VRLVAHDERIHLVLEVLGDLNDADERGLSFGLLVVGDGAHGDAVAGLGGGAHAERRGAREGGGK
jgi:hypothetical protein